MTDELKRPSLTIDIKTDEGLQTVRMSYGLFTDLSRMVPEATAVIEIALVDPIARDYLIRRAMTPVSKSINEEKDLIEEVNFTDLDEVEKLLGWIAEHLLYFFKKSARSMQTLGEGLRTDLKVKMDRLVPSSDGSETSPSSTPTAGPSDAASQT